MQKSFLNGSIRLKFSGLFYFFYDELNILQIILLKITNVSIGHLKISLK